MATEVGVAYVSIVPSARGFAQKLQGEVGGEVSKFGTTAGAASGKKFSGGFLGGATGLVKGIGGLLAASAVKNFFTDSIAEAREAQKVTAQTNAVIKSTGGVANVSAKQISNLANAISLKSGMDDESIQTGANLLLTFRNLRNETGKGNDVFNQATQAITDLSVGMNQDLKSSAVQLGKALNDPIKGITALSRVGVTFDDQQKNQIKTMVAHNNVIGAQKIILAELTKEFGGSAAAQATAGDKMKVAWKNLEEQIGTALLPTLDKLETALVTKGIPAASKFIKQMQSGKGAGGQFADALGNIKDIAVDLLPVVKGVTKAFLNLPDGAQKVLILAGAAALLAKRFGVIPVLLPKVTGALAAETAAAEGAATATAGASLAMKGLAVGLAIYAVGQLGNKFFAANNSASDFKKTIQELAQGGPASSLKLDFGISSLGGDLKEASQEVKLFGGLAAKTWDFMNTSGDVEHLDHALAHLQKNSPAQARAAFGQIKAQAEQAGVSMKDLIALFPAFRHQVKETAQSRGTIFDTATTLIPALNGLKAYRDQLIKLPKKALTQVLTPGATDSLKEVTDLAKKFHLQPPMVKTIMRAEDFSTPQINKVLKELGILDKKHTNSKLGADVRGAMAAVKTVLGAFGVVDKAKPKGHLNADGKGAIQSSQSVLKWFGVIDRSNPTAKVDANTSSAMSKLQAIRNAIDAVTGNFFATIFTTHVTKKAGGGLVRGPGSGTSDSIAAQLSNGEFVMRAAAVKRYGLDTLNQMNAMHLASGGPVGGPRATAYAPHANGGGTVAVFNLYDANNVLIGTMQGVAAQTAHAANRVSMQRANSARRTGIG